MAETLPKRTKEQIDQEYGQLAAHLGDFLIRMIVLKPKLMALIAEADTLQKDSIPSQEVSTLG